MLEFYKSLNVFSSQRWRWRVTAENSRIVAASSEGFSSEFKARENARLTYVLLRTAVGSEVDAR